MKITVAVISLIIVSNLSAQKDVNVFLGTSGDHGQLSPAASYPFNMLSIGPQTYPSIHTGYEYHATAFLGFTHNRMEGVGCMGSGGAILIKPFTGSDATSCRLEKKKENGEPGYYHVRFTNDIDCSFAVNKKEGIERYIFPKGKKGFRIDFSSALMNGFVSESHKIFGNEVSGWVEAGTTCRRGKYKLYYALRADKNIEWKENGDHVVVTQFPHDTVLLHIAFSSVSVEYAKASLSNRDFAGMQTASKTAWQKLLNAIEVKGNPKEANLFYSLLYRVIQSPYSISEQDGKYRAIDGSIETSNHTIYNGWSIWDNYKTQLPLLSIAYPKQYQDIVSSIASLYNYGKKDWATLTEPSNTVRTEHAVVILLDASRKGFQIDFSPIIDSLIKESEHLDFSHPDKALESSYDLWTLSGILTILHKDSLANVYRQKVLQYRKVWEQNFQDISKPDADDYGARVMYQGTVWQYRWFVPFDQKGLVELCGGDSAYIAQLDQFFGNDFYNAANEPDIQAPYLYNFSSQPWKSQEMIHKYAKDTVVQYYTDINYRGINPQIGRVYNNRPDAFLQSMDDDAGAMSSWYVLAACGLSPACVGEPVYYLSVPLFERVAFNKTFVITVKNFKPANKYIQSVSLNGRNLDKNWITQDDITKGGRLIITASDKPNKAFGIRNQWMTELNKN